MNEDPRTPEHLEALRRSVEVYASRQDHKKRLRALRSHLPGYDRAVWREMAGLGWLSINIPTQFGGSGLGLRELATVAEGLASVCAPEPFTAACALACGTIVSGDAHRMQSALLPAVAQGDLLPALAWQETFDQIDPLNVATTATDARGTVTLRGIKRWVHGGAGADGFVVSARARDGVQLYWVPASAQGLHTVPQLLADGRYAVSLELSDVCIPEDHLIASAPCTARSLPRALDEAAILVGAELSGVASSALDATIEYLRVRRQFGRPIGSFQALQHRAVDCYVQLRLARAVLAEALQAIVYAADAAVVAGLASRVKSRCTTAAQLIAREAIQMHGAIGFTDACDISIYVQRTLVLAACLGSPVHHRRRFAAVEPMHVSDVPSGHTEVRRPLEDYPATPDWNALPDDEFRLLFRHFIERHYPPSLRYLPRRVHWHEVRDWNRKLAQHGWIAPTWPRAWGGMELAPVKQIIYIEELERWGVGRAPDQGVRQLGPVLIRYGTEQQKANYLPKILACEHIWCQGYSEPEAGSDLASVGTRAHFVGDDIVIDGRKIWTSMAMDCTHIYVLCRTDQTAKKQEGITFVIVELDRPGITIRPILDIAGNEEFCEIVFDAVRVPAANVVGGINKGWTVAKAVLDLERLGIGSPWRPRIALTRLARLAAKLNLFEDRGFLDRFTELRIDLLDQAAAYAEFADLTRRGETLGPDVSILKIWGMEVFQRLTEFSLETASAYGGAGGAIQVGEDTVDLLSPYYMARLITIGGGSNEIQRNIVAKRILQLPSEPR